MICSQSPCNRPISKNSLRLLGAPNNLREFFEIGLLHGDWEHIIYEEDRITYPETYARANQLGNVLQSTFGIEKGDKVSFSMRNYPEWMFCYMAI